MKDHQKEMTDFMETAKLVQSLDLVISVDTSIAHLAGALGKPVWILLSFAPARFITLKFGLFGPTFELLLFGLPFEFPDLNPPGVGPGLNPPGVGPPGVPGLRRLRLLCFLD